MDIGWEPEGYFSKLFPASLGTLWPFVLAQHS
jgi:hypothetical protein